MRVSGPTSRFLSQNLWGGVGWGEDLRVFVKISTEAPWCEDFYRSTLVVPKLPALLPGGRGTIGSEGSPRALISVLDLA